MSHVQNDRCSNMDGRVARFRSELTWAVSHYRRLAKRTHRINVLLMTIVGVTSFCAAVLGLADLADTRVVGAIALMPSLISSFAISLKVQEKSDQHYRRKDALQLLLNKLDFELPLHPNEADIAALSMEWADLTDRMNDEWARSLLFDWERLAAEQTGNRSPGWLGTKRRRVASYKRLAVRRRA